MKRHIWLVATGQAVSNLGPLLECHQSEDTVWVVEPQLLAPEMTERLLESIDSLGIQARTFRDPLPADLNESSAWGEDAHRQMNAVHSGPVVLVSNGGKKPISRALDGVLGDRLLLDIYGEGEPVQLLENERTGKFSTRSYSDPPRRLLDLDTILAASGHARLEGHGTLWWSASGKPCATPGPVPTVFSDGDQLARQYDSSQQNLLRRKQRFQELWAEGDARLLTAGKTRMTLKTILDTAKISGSSAAASAADQWGDALKAADVDIIKPLVEHWRVQAPDWDGIKAKLEQSMQAALEVMEWPLNTFSGQNTIELQRDQVARAMEAALQSPPPVPLRPAAAAALFEAAVRLHWEVSGVLHSVPARTGDPLGASFELAVGRRLLDELQKQPAWRGVISEIWHGVRVVRRGGESSKVTAEWDVLLVLRNGVLINVECKSWRDSRKELDARRFVIREGGSSLADMWVCSPLPTAFADRDWFSDMHGFRQDVTSLDRLHLAYTLADQPKSYWVGRSLYDCPSLEEQLGQAMERYVPFR